MSETGMRMCPGKCGYPSNPDPAWAPWCCSGCANYGHSRGCGSECTAYPENVREKSDRAPDDPAVRCSPSPYPSTKPVNWCDTHQCHFTKPDDAVCPIASLYAEVEKLRGDLDFERKNHVGTIQRSCDVAGKLRAEVALHEQRASEQRETIGRLTAQLAERDLQIASLTSDLAAERKKANGCLYDAIVKAVKKAAQESGGA